MPSETSPILNRDHIRPGDRLCAAVSGGADSVAMLLLLHQANTLQRNGLGIGLSAAHVHHGIRGDESDRDADFVRDLCFRLQVPLHFHRVDVPARLASTRAAGDPETLEEAARRCRYDFFHKLILAGEANIITTAHTLDDQAETVLMKLLRGAWTEGLAGIFPAVEVSSGRPTLAGPTFAGRIVRPLLAARRAELRDFLELRQQPWREDTSNQDEAHTRNRLRHTVLPMLRLENPAIDRTLAQLATLAREDDARWNLELGRLLSQLLLPGKPVRGGGRSVSTDTGQGSFVAIELERLRGLDPALRRRLFRAAARQLGGRLVFEDTERLLVLAGMPGNRVSFAPAGRRSGKLELSGGLRAECSPRELRIYRL